jgi:hypothetical protein
MNVIPLNEMILKLAELVQTRVRLAQLDYQLGINQNIEFAIEHSFFSLPDRLFEAGGLQKTESCLSALRKLEIKEGMTKLRPSELSQYLFLI